MSYNYPGNIRELANIIERAFILCRNGLIEKKHLPDKLLNPSANSPKEAASSLQDAQAAYLINVLKQNNWNRLQTARQLGINKSTLYRKIKALGINLPK